MIKLTGYYRTDLPSYSRKPKNLTMIPSQRRRHIRATSHPSYATMVTTPDRSEWSKEYHASYTAKDLMQYALAVGCCSDGNVDEQRYAFEEDPHFEAFPSFCFALPSWASSSSNASISYVQPFPTPLMTHMGVIPRDCLKDRADIGSLPVIHISQSATWLRSIVAPPLHSGDRQVHTLVSSRGLSVTPKSIGTFVETETRIRTATEPLCTLSSTLLVLGMDPSLVTPMPRRVQIKVPRAPSKSPPTYEWSYTTTANQALLYRLASGDFNTIHVDPSTTSTMMPESSDTPILHGLCTLGIALRGLLRMVQHKDTVVSLHARFTKPIFVGDTLTLQAWDDTDDPETITFRVLNTSSGAIALDGGILKRRRRSGTETTSTSAYNRAKL